MFLRILNNLIEKEASFDCMLLTEMRLKCFDSALGRGRNMLSFKINESRIYVIVKKDWLKGGKKNFRIAFNFYFAS